MNANDPAHPSTMFMGPHGEVCTPQYYGLTKRELIAAMCLQGLLSNSGLFSEGRDVDNEKYNGVMVRKAIARADALILELSKEQKP